MRDDLALTDLVNLQSGYHSASDIDNLVRYTNSAPSSAPVAARMRSGSSAARLARQAQLASAGPVFDELYRDTRPTQPLQESKMAGMRDPVHRHGAQLMELRNIEKQSERFALCCSTQYSIVHVRTCTCFSTVSAGVLID